MKLHQPGLNLGLAVIAAPAALATALSVTRNVSVQVGISTPGQPNIAATQWRTLSDHKNQVYYFESAFSPYLLAVNLAKLDFF